jgi:branched-subunit amino acid transport protein
MDAEVKRSYLWLEHGDLILQAGSKQFRVYKDILKRSWPSIFDAIPQPKQVLGGDGLPAVEFFPADDDPDTVEHVLKALHDRSYVPASALRAIHLDQLTSSPSNRHFAIYKPHSFSVILSVLALATKYQIMAIILEIRASLVRFFPLTVDEWDLSWETRVAYPITGLEEPANLITFINLCHVHLELFTPLLPGAYARVLCLSSMEDIVTLNMAPDTMTRLLVGRVNILREIFDQKRVHYCSANRTCSDSSCHRDQFSKAITGPLEAVFACSPRIKTNVEEWISCGGSQICKNCKPVLVQYVLTCREEIWAKLPKLLNVGSNWASQEGILSEQVMSAD